MTDQQVHWDTRYRRASAVPRPARVLAENSHLLPTRGTALDLASGNGGNALCLARHGLTTEAWDISPVALEQLEARARTAQLELTCRVRDVVRRPPGSRCFDVICVSHFLERTLASPIVAALKPGGLLFYQTFTRNHPAHESPGPRNPAYRLADNELLALFLPALQLRVYREEDLSGDTTGGFRGMAMLVAQAPGESSE